MRTAPETMMLPDGAASIALKLTSFVAALYTGVSEASCRAFLSPFITVTQSVA